MQDEQFDQLSRAIAGLAEAVSAGFARIDMRFDAMDLRFDAMEQRMIDASVKGSLRGVNVRLDRLERPRRR